MDGNITYSTQTVLKYLEQENIRHGILKKSVNCAEVASMLRREFPNITWVSARIEGTRLFLEMKENYNQEQEQQTVDQESTPLDIVAKSGTVMSIVTRSGVPLVKVGDQFKKAISWSPEHWRLKMMPRRPSVMSTPVRMLTFMPEPLILITMSFPWNTRSVSIRRTRKTPGFFTVMNYRVDIGPSPLKISGTTR